MNKNVYAKIPNIIMGVNTHIENENGNNIYTNEGSILDIVKDDKVIKVVYELIVGTNFRGLCVISLEDLIINCGYPVNKDNKISFTKLLIAMSENEFISLDKIDFKPKDILHIETDKLTEGCIEGYTVLEEKELDIINKKFSDNRERNTNLKGYLFIKQMVHKRKDNTNSGLTYELETQSKVMDYKYIAKFTGIKDITKCIKSLKELEMINYDNFIEYPIGEPQKKMDSKNIYVVRALEDNWDVELMNEELKIALKQYKNERKNKGFVVATEYKNNNKKINGLKGQIQKQKNENKDTTILEEKLKNDSNAFKDNTTKHKGIRKSCSCMEEDYFEFCRQVKKKDDKAIDDSIQEAINNVKVVKVKKKKDKKYVYQSRIIDEYTDAELNDLLSIN
ncbi:hypothetical protein NE172_04850 [Clostridium botulinum]|uniref:Uncharacterized protein n=1 Tax=Clostridium botulinum TaxID=1491 RepID=A0A6B4JIZ2_CLOBO|nr:hypothetical protein [Clostridium botulinum]EES49609.1 hypothetical protein CLO_1341 [Clostridium botulinum E1 str. 'BoNT E Beluga']MBY6760489.1 hypothetical protein [Clostridium botulinum]MBY6919396.1 hypothetical protein [Clostridium botulinum]MCR1130274.1 hypothetical protein [Clostridium botulinum]NFJ56964.1 hypothetical protein [Clostridium botulinum]